MPSKRPFKVSRDQPGGITPGSYGRKAPSLGASPATWSQHMAAARGGAKEVMVKISGGGRDADGVQAHFEYIDRHGKLPIETDHGETLQGKTSGAALANDWGLGYGDVPGAPHSRNRLKTAGERRGPRQAFNIVLSMPAGTPPQKVLNAAKKLAREEFAHQHRYAMALHANHANGHGKHPHVHLVVKAEHEYGGPRLNPRKADLRRWRERFAEYLMEQGVAATATRRADRGLVKTAKKTPIYRAMSRAERREPSKPVANLYTEAGDSKFMRRKLESVRRELDANGSVQDRETYQALLRERIQVKARYDDAARWLRTQQRETEARRFELLRDSLPPIRTEKQLLAEMVGNVRSRTAFRSEPPSR